MFFVDAIEREGLGNRHYLVGGAQAAVEERLELRPVATPGHTPHLDEVPTGTVWVHCAGGMRAGIATSLLDAAGRDVAAVDADFDSAAEAGLSVLTG